MLLYWNASHQQPQMFLGVQPDTQDSFCVRAPHGDKNWLNLPVYPQ